MGLIALYRLGVLKHLPEPPLPGLDAEKVNGSAQAYGLLATPDKRSPLSGTYTGSQAS